MSRIVIVARTRMHGDHVCIGGHDLDARFRAVRLLDWFGDHWRNDTLFQVGDVWRVRYSPKESARPPHVEDVFVEEHSHMGRVQDLKELVLTYTRPWAGSAEALFEGTVRSTSSGTAYIPPKGRLPRCSTGYWMPDEDLVHHLFKGKPRFASTGAIPAKWFTWVGVCHPPQRIEAGSLVRVSLSRLFKPETAPEGYYVQISGVI